MVQQQTFSKTTGWKHRTKQGEVRPWSDKEIVVCILFILCKCVGDRSLLQVAALNFSYCLYFISFDPLPCCVDDVPFFTPAAHVKFFLGSSCPSGRENCITLSTAYYSSLLSPLWQHLMSHAVHSCILSLPFRLCLCLLHHAILTH